MRCKKKNNEVFRMNEVETWVLTVDDKTYKAKNVKDLFAQVVVDYVDLEAMKVKICEDLTDRYMVCSEFDEYVEDYDTVYSDFYKGFSPTECIYCLQVYFGEDKFKDVKFFNKIDYI